MIQWIADHSYYMPWPILVILLFTTFYVLRNEGKEISDHVPRRKIRIPNKKGKFKFKE